MRKLILSTAVLLVALPLGARADVGAALTDNAWVSIFYSDDSTYITGDLWIESATSPAPAIDPDSLFPIVIDPNDPPEPPVALTETTQTLRGYLNGCGELEDEFGNPTFRCFGGDFEQPFAPGDLTFDGVPLPGNAMTFSATVEIDGPFGDPMFVDLDGSFAEPRNTVFDPCPTCTSVNPWIHDGATHVDVDAYDALIVRNGYDGSVAVTAPDMFTGTVPAGAGMYYYTALSAHADAEI